MIKFSSKVSKLLEKADKVDKVGVYKNEDLYYVTQGTFAFITTDVKALQKLGLIDFSGNPKKQFETVKNVIQKSDMANIDLSDTGILLDKGKNILARVLKSDSAMIVVNQEYFDMLKGCSFRHDGGKTFAIYAYEGSELVGLLLPCLMANAIQELVDISKFAK